MRRKKLLRIPVFIIILSLIISACSPQPTDNPLQPTPTQTATPDPLSLIPPEVTGEVLYIPFPVEISIDGNLSDWEDLPSYYVDRGPSLSTDPAENGSFTFSVASDVENLYITMQMPDKNIITGKHGSEFWNEDSMEFYINASDDLNSSDYSLKMFQVNLNAVDIGKTDPNGLTITGVFSSDAKVTGYVFKTEDGWGFEAALSLEDLLEVFHGKEIGFQAQINGATTADRDVKLIWSNADTSDQSWEHPNLFGRALFFELGRTDIPQPSMVVAAAEPLPTPTPVVIPDLVSINQVGYFTNAEKIALLDSDSQTPVAWILRDASGSEVLTGLTTIKGEDKNSGDYLHVIDFSTWETAGSGYTIAVEQMQSAAFIIADDLYAPLKKDALAYFYLNRSGTAIDPEFAGETWSRPAGHLTDSEVTCFKGTDADGNDWLGCDYTLDASGGWYDAGDYGKYVVNGGISAWTLMNLYEQGWDSYPDGTQPIPEMNNAVPDLLDEARWEMEFLLSMQVPEGQPQAGMVHHKLHDESWAAMPLIPPMEVDNDNENLVVGSGRYVFAPSTAATLNLAATAAQCSRIWREIDRDFSSRCLTAAVQAWKAAVDNPGIFAGNNPGSGGGNYSDEKVADEFYWSAAELFVTTGEQEYMDFLLNSPEFGMVTSFDWGNTATLGTITLLTVTNDLSVEKREVLMQNLQDYASGMQTIQQMDGYFVLIDGDYPWGSNGLLLNNMMLMSVAYELSGDADYINSVRLGMDYLLGRNTLNRSFISGYGTYTMAHPHHRFWANDPGKGYPAPPPGVVSGGPNFYPADPAADAADLMSLPPSARYLDEIESFTTNEVTINWNAPLVWVVSFLYKLGR